MSEKTEKKTGAELDRNIENPYRYTESTEVSENMPEQNMEEESRSTQERPEQSPKGKKSSGKKSFWKAAVNAAVILLNGFVIALIVCLFAAQPEHGEKVKPSIQKFSVNSDQYYSEHETYQQINANIHIFESDGRPD